MKAMVLDRPESPLRLAEVEKPEPGPGEITVKVKACGVCRTDLHVVDGDLPDPNLPIIPGHEIVGTVEALGEGVAGLTRGERVGIPWLGRTCGVCHYCTHGQENLCDTPGFTGYQINGGYAEYTRASADYCFPLPARYGDAEAAPLLCAGLIGYRSYKIAGEAHNLGLYGFGAAAHILAQVAIAGGRRVFAFTRSGDAEGQAFARKLGVAWAGGSDELPPEPLDAAIIFAPVGALIPQALRAVRKGGRVVSGGIHMSDIPQFPYSLLWEERSIHSVANLTRDDGREFFALAATTPISVTTTPYPLSKANEALDDLRHGRFHGAAVLIPD